MSLKYKDEEFAEKIWDEFYEDTKGEWNQFNNPTPKDVIKWLIIKEYLKPIPKPAVRTHGGDL